MVWLINRWEVGKVKDVWRENGDRQTEKTNLNRYTSRKIHRHRDGQRNKEERNQS